MKMIAEYLETAIKFQRMAEDEKNNPKLKASLEKQAAAYRKLALARAKKLGVVPPPSSAHVVRPTTTEPIACPHCGGQAYLMRRTPHPKITGEIWKFECKDCGGQTEKSVLH
jgi:hypothetical protein